MLAIRCDGQFTSSGLNLASTINRNYVLQNQTAMVVWNLIYSWYSILPFAHPVAGTVGGMGHGLMSATEPWSGHYQLQPPLYMMMYGNLLRHHFRPFVTDYSALRYPHAM